MVYGRPDVSGLLNAQAAPDDRLWGRRPSATVGMRLVLRVFSSVVDRLARRSHVFTNALDGVAGSGGGRKQEGQSCKGSFHIGSPCPSATTADRGVNAACATKFHAFACRNRSPQLAFNIPTNRIRQEQDMLGWALTFFILAIVAAAFGFGGIAGASAAIAQVLFVIFLVLTVIAFIVRAIQGRPVV
jgi:uncharacterized membrane protein YtjA (UPF0391 family)